MKKAHPGVHPEAEGSKKPRAKAAERRPAAASAENPMRMTVEFEMELSNLMVYLRLTEDCKDRPDCADHLV